MISADDIGLIYDDEGNVRHKDAKFRAQVGGVFLGYFIYEDQVEEAKAAYRARFYREFEDIEKEAQAYKMSLSEIKNQIESARKLISELKARARKLEKRAQKPLALYESRLAEARILFGHEP